MRMKKNLESLYDILMRLRAGVNTPNLQSVIKDLINSVAEELQEGELKFRATKRNKRSLLPFVGTALKSLFGVSTADDTDQAKERLNKLERWAAQQGSAYNTVIEGVNENSKGIKEIADSFNEVIRYINQTSVARSKEQYFTGLAIEC